MLDRLLYGSILGDTWRFLRFWTINFESDFGEEMSAVERHIEVLKEEATLCHRLRVHKFMTENRLPSAHSGSNPSNLEEVRYLKFVYILTYSEF